MTQCQTAQEADGAGRLPGHFPSAVQVCQRVEIRSPAPISLIVWSSSDSRGVGLRVDDRASAAARSASSPASDRSVRFCRSERLCLLRQDCRQSAVQFILVVFGGQVDGASDCGRRPISRARWRLPRPVAGPGDFPTPAVTAKHRDRFAGIGSGTSHCRSGMTNPVNSDARKNRLSQVVRRSESDRMARIRAPGLRLRHRRRPHLSGRDRGTFGIETARAPSVSGAP